MNSPEEYFAELIRKLTLMGYKGYIAGPEEQPIGIGYLRVHTDEISDVILVQGDSSALGYRAFCDPSDDTNGPFNPKHHLFSTHGKAVSVLEKMIGLPDPGTLEEESERKLDALPGLEVPKLWVVASFRPVPIEDR
ncbi:hypothetical protein [Amycolatopsis sp. NPDC059657]|uniref:hypothetical protein n=1 Tax=Amycolatopsis sp. NPDC059657 TaxID=3346899 RepID=UPI0036733C91